MTDAELDLLMRDVLLDSLKLDDAAALDSDLAFTPSRRHQRRMRSMMSDPEKWLRGRTRPVWQKVMQWVAVFILVVLINFGAVMAFSPTARAAVLQWIVEWYETYISFQYFGETKPEEMLLYQITDLPEGYFETERIDDVLSTDVIYENSAGEFLYIRYTHINQGIESVIIPGDDEVIPISVNQMEGYLFIPKDSENRTTITWIDEQKNIQFTIAAMFEPDELLRMAESTSEKSK